MSINPATIPTLRPDDLYLRLSVNHPRRTMSPHYVGLSLAENLCVTNTEVIHTTRINTRTAIIAANNGARNALAGSCQLEESEMKLEIASEWITVLAPKIIDQLFTLQGSISVTTDIVI